jgi:anaerobic selenocysteine-containing dehydrogenase
MDGVTFERLAREGYARLDLPTPFLPYEKPLRLGTPSGKIQIHSPALERMDFDPLPSYIPPLEMGSNPSGRFPLSLLSPPEHEFMNSTFVNIPALSQSAGSPKLLIHPMDAAERRIEGGERVRIGNDRGDFVAMAVVTDEVRRGVVVSYGVRWARFSEEGTTVNDTTSQRETDLGGGGVFYDNAVEVALTSSPFEKGIGAGSRHEAEVPG